MKSPAAPIRKSGAGRARISDNVAPRAGRIAAGISARVLVLREMEGMSYKEIADVAAVSIGTVMSRLARGRRHLQLSFPNRNDPRRNSRNFGPLR